MECSRSKGLSPMLPQLCMEEALGSSIRIEPTASAGQSWGVLRENLASPGERTAPK